MNKIDWKLPLETEAGEHLVSLVDQEGAGIAVAVVHKSTCCMLHEEDGRWFFISSRASRIYIRNVKPKPEKYTRWLVLERDGKSEMYTEKGWTYAHKGTSPSCAEIREISWNSDGSPVEDDASAALKALSDAIPGDKEKDSIVRLAELVMERDTLLAERDRQLSVFWEASADK